MPLPPGRSIAMLPEDGGGTHEYPAEKLGLSLPETRRPDRWPAVADRGRRQPTRCFALPADWWLDQERRWRESQG